METRRPGETNSKPMSKAGTPNGDKRRASLSDDFRDSQSADDLVFGKLAILDRLRETMTSNTANLGEVMTALTKKLEVMDDDKVINRLDPRALLMLLKKVSSESLSFVQASLRVTDEWKQQLYSFQQEYSVSLLNKTCQNKPSDKPSGVFTNPNTLHSSPEKSPALFLSLGDHLSRLVDSAERCLDLHEESSDLKIKKLEMKLNKLSLSLNCLALTCSEKLRILTITKDR